MSSQRNDQLNAGWKAFSYFCCSAWNDAYLIDISRAATANTTSSNKTYGLGTQRSQFVPVTQIYTSIDALSRTQRLCSALEYPMAPNLDVKTNMVKATTGYTDISSSAYKAVKDLDSDTQNMILGNVVSISNQDSSGANLVLNGSISLPQLLKSNKQFGYGVKSKPKMYDTVKIAELEGGVQYSVAVTPTRVSYLGHGETTLSRVQNLAPRRVQYIIHAEKTSKKASDLSGGVTCNIVQSAGEIKQETDVCIQADIDMFASDTQDDDLDSLHFGKVQVGYSYEYDTKNGNPLSQTGGVGAKYLIIDCVPTVKCRDSEYYVTRLSEEFFGVGVNETTGNYSLGYVSYNSIGDKNSLFSALSERSYGTGSPFASLKEGSRFSYPRGTGSSSVGADNWFSSWNAEYRDLADSLQGKISSREVSSTFAQTFNVEGKKGGIFSGNYDNSSYSNADHLVAQTSLVNRNHLQKLLNVQTSASIDSDESIQIYITVVEDWVNQRYNKYDSRYPGVALNAAYIPYLDARASRQIISLDYDIFDSDKLTNNAYDANNNDLSANVPHQTLDVINDFPSWDDKDALGGAALEPNKDLILFDWRAKSLAQPTFACCSTTAVENLGIAAANLSLEKYHHSNNYDLDKKSYRYVLDTTDEFHKMVEEGSQELVYINNSTQKTITTTYKIDSPDVYVHAVESVHYAHSTNRTSNKRLFRKIKAGERVFRNYEEAQTDDSGDRNNLLPNVLIPSRYEKLPWFTWSGDSLPTDLTKNQAEGDFRCVLTGNAIRAMKMVMRTGSILVNGFVWNHNHIGLNTDSLIDAVTEFTLYTAWHNMKHYFRELDNLVISSIVEPKLTSDLSGSSIQMPSWRQVLIACDNIKTAQFFRSKLVSQDELETMVRIDVSFNANHPPLLGGSADSSQVDTDGNTVWYNDISSAKWRNQATYYATNSSGNAQTFIGLTKPIMWDPKGTYPKHILVPKDRRGQTLGDDWSKLCDISCQGILRNSGNCLQASKLNYYGYQNKGETGVTVTTNAATFKIMHCTPFVPVGGVQLVSATASENAEIDIDVYRHQDIAANTSTGSVIVGHLRNDRYAATTGENVVTTSAASNNVIGPLASGNLVTAGTLPRGLGWNSTSKIFDRAEDQRRMHIHRVSLDGNTSIGLFTNSNNMALGVLAWSLHHNDWVETGEGYHPESLSLDTVASTTDFYIADALYRTQTFLSFFASGYGLYGDKKISFAPPDHDSNTCPHTSKKQKRFLSGPDATNPSTVCDMLSLGRNITDELIPHLNLDTAYRWVGPSTHYLMEPNTEELWKYTIGAVENTGNSDRDSFYRNSSLVRSEAWASSSEINDRVKTYLQNGNPVHDATVAQADVMKKGCFYQDGDFIENRVSMFALSRTYDISRNVQTANIADGETKKLTCVDRREDDIVYTIDLSKNSAGGLCYFADGKNADQVSELKGQVKINTANIVEFGRLLGVFLKEMKPIKLASDRSSLVLSDPQLLTLPADEKLNTTKIKAAAHNPSEYSRLQGDVVDYTDNNLKLLDLTNFDEAKAESAKGGALVEAVWYMSDSSSSTIRIIYPTPMRNDVFRPEMNGALVAVRCYAVEADSNGAKASLLGNHQGSNSVTIGSGVDNDSDDKNDVKGHFIFGRGGIVVKKQQAMLGVVDNLPGSQDSSFTAATTYIKAFINAPATTKLGSHGVGSYANNYDMTKESDQAIVNNETSEKTRRYRHFSILTITGVRDFMLPDSTDTPRFGSMILPGTNKTTKYVLANHINDKKSVDTEIAEALVRGEVSDSETNNITALGWDYDINENDQLEGYCYELTDIPGYVAGSWRKVQPFIASPSMNNIEANQTGLQDQVLNKGELLRPNFGVIIKKTTSAQTGQRAGISSLQSLEPVKFSLTAFTTISPADGVRWSDNGTAQDAKYENAYKSGKKPVGDKMILRSVTLSENEVMNFYSLNTELYLDSTNNPLGHKRVISEFSENMPEKLSQYLAYIRRGVLPFMIDDRVDQAWSTNSLPQTRFWYHLKNYVKTRTLSTNSTLDVSMSAQYNGNLLDLEQNLIQFKSLQDEFNKQIMSWNEGIVGAKIGDMVVGDFDNISGEQVVDTSETLTELPGFHILMYLRLLDPENENGPVTVVAPTMGTRDFYLTSGKDGETKGALDDVQINIYDQDMLVGKGARTVQFEQVISNKNPVVKAVASRGSVNPAKKYQYGVYKENMWIQAYKGTLASSPSQPVTREILEVADPDSIGLNVEQVKAADKNYKNKNETYKSGVMILQHANVLYEKHNGINITVPTSILQVKDALSESDSATGKKLELCMVVVPELDNNNIAKVGVNPSNTSLLSFIANERDSVNVGASHFAMSSCVIDCGKVGEGSGQGEFLINRSSNNDQVLRDVQINVICDLFRSKNTTKVTPIIALNKLPSIDLVKEQLIYNKTQLSTADQNSKLPFLENEIEYAANYMVVSRFMYKVDSSGNTSAGTIAAHQSGRQTLLDLFQYNNEVGADSNYFTITSQDGNRGIETDELNGANGYDGGDYTGFGNGYFEHDKDATGNVLDVSGKALHFYKAQDSRRIGYADMWVENLIYFTELLKRPLIDGEDSLSNIFWKINDDESGQWVNKPKLLTDESTTYQNRLESYRKSVVSTLIRTMPSNKELFVTQILNRSIPRVWVEEGKNYSAFAQIEFLANFREQLVEKKYSNKSRVVNSKQLRYPIYVYKHGDDLCFPNWSEVGVIDSNGDYVTNYEQKVNYDWAVNYYGLDFVNDILDSNTGFGFQSNVDVGVESRVKEFKERLTKFLNDENVTSRLSSGAKAIYNLVKSLVSVCNPLEVNSLKEFNSKVNLVQLNSSALEFFFSLANKFQESYVPAFSVKTSTIIGSHVNVFKNKFDLQNFQLKLNVARLDVNLLKEATAFDIKEITFSDNNLLTLDLLSPVGNPQELFLPIVFKTEAKKVTTVKSRKVEITTDYLLETLNDIDITELMNNVCYIIDESGNRIVLSPSEMNRVPFFSLFPNCLLDNEYNLLFDDEWDPKGKFLPKFTQYESLTTPHSSPSYISDTVATDFYADITLKERNLTDKEVNASPDISRVLPAHTSWLARKLARTVFGQNEESSIALSADLDTGRLKLANVKQDDSARGQLRDYRYPGVKFDISSNVPIFAESVPNTNGGFACQVLRMIKSGLVGRPEDEKILGEENEVVRQIAGKVYKLSALNFSVGYFSADLLDASGAADFFTGKYALSSSSTPSTVQHSDPEKAHPPKNANALFHPEEFMQLKLQERTARDTTDLREGGYVPMQFILQQLLSNDYQRFVINERERKRQRDYEKETNGFKGENYSVVWRNLKGRTINNANKNLSIFADPLSLPSGDAESNFNSAFRVHDPRSDPTYAATSNVQDQLLSSGSTGPSNGLPFLNKLAIMGRHLDCSLNHPAYPRTANMLGGAAFAHTVKAPAGTGAADRYAQYRWLSAANVLPGKEYEVYMLPLMETDTISIVLTNDGQLRDPIEDSPGAESVFSRVMTAVTNKIKGLQETVTGTVATPGTSTEPTSNNVTELDNNDTLLNINNSSGTGNLGGGTGNDTLADYVEQMDVDNYPSITGHGVNLANPANPVKGVKQGLYFDSVNLLVAPEIGPYEKAKISAWALSDRSAVIDGESAATGSKTQLEMYYEKIFNDANSNNYVTPGGKLGNLYGNSKRAGQIQRSKYLGNTIYLNKLKSGQTMDISMIQVDGSGTIVNRLDEFYQKFITRSFTVKYKLNDVRGVHSTYNDLRINEIVRQEIVAFETRDVDERPLINISEPDSGRYVTEHYEHILAQGVKAEQVGTARPTLINSTPEEITLAAGSILIPRRFDGKPLDPNIDVERSILIKKSAFEFLDPATLEVIKGTASQETVAVSNLKIAFKLSFPMNNGGLYSILLLVSVAGKKSYATFQDLQFSDDYLVFFVEDIPSDAAAHPTIPISNTMHQLQNAIVMTIGAQINPSQVEPFLPVISERPQPPPNEEFNQPVLLPSTPGGGVVVIAQDNDSEGKLQRQTYFQPVNVLLSLLQGEETHFEPKAQTNNYYIRISRDNKLWTNMLQEAANNVLLDASNAVSGTVGNTYKTIFESGSGSSISSSQPTDTSGIIHAVNTRWTGFKQLAAGWDAMKDASANTNGANSKKTDGFFDGNPGFNATSYKRLEYNVMSMYSLDLLVCLWTECDPSTTNANGVKWTHKSLSTERPKVAFNRVPAEAVFNGVTARDFTVPNKNSNVSLSVPILVVSDVGKSWYDYEGTVMSAQRFNRLCEVLGDPGEGHAFDFGSLRDEDEDYVPLSFTGHASFNGAQNRRGGVKHDIDLTDAQKWRQDIIDIDANASRYFSNHPIFNVRMGGLIGIDVSGTLTGVAAVAHAATLNPAQPIPGDNAHSLISYTAPNSNADIDTANGATGNGIQKYDEIYYPAASYAGNRQTNDGLKFEGTPLILTHPSQIIVSAEPFTKNGLNIDLPETDYDYSEMSLEGGILANANKNILGYIHHKSALATNQSASDDKDVFKKALRDAGSRMFEGLALAQGKDFATDKTRGSSKREVLALDDNNKILRLFEDPTTKKASLTLMEIIRFTGRTHEDYTSTNLTGNNAVNINNGILYPWINISSQVKADPTGNTDLSKNLTLQTLSPAGTNNSYGGVNNRAANPVYYISAVETNGAGDSYYLDIRKGNASYQQKAIDYQFPDDGNLTRADLSGSYFNASSDYDGTYAIPIATEIGQEFYSQVIKYDPTDNVADGDADSGSRTVFGSRYTAIGTLGGAKEFRHAGYDGYLLEGFRVRMDPYSQNNVSHPSAHLDSSRYRRAGSTHYVDGDNVVELGTTLQVPRNMPTNFAVNAQGVASNATTNEVFYLRTAESTAIGATSVVADEVAWMTQENQEKLWNMIRFFSTRQAKTGQVDGVLTVNSSGVTEFDENKNRDNNGGFRTRERRPLSFFRPWYKQADGQEEGEPKNKGALL